MKMEDKHLKAIFIGGTGRSGTSILSKYLGTHSQIYQVPIETKFIADKDGVLDLYASLTSNFNIVQGKVAIHRFIKLMDKNELFIFKYSGITNNRILSILVLCSFFLGILIIFGFYTFSSKLKSHYLQIKNEFTADNKYLAVITENGLWIKDEINGKINIINADKIDRNFLINVSIVQFDKNFNILQSIESKEVDVKSKYWIIKNPIITKENLTNKLEFVNLNSNFDLEKISNLFSNLSAMSIMELTKLKKDYYSLGYSTVDIAVHQHKIFSIPIYLSIMTLLSGIIMINSKYKKSKIFNIILGISLSVIIYYVNYFSGLLGVNGKVPIILSVWLPLIVLILISMIGLVRLNEK